MSDKPQGMRQVSSTKGLRCPWCYHVHDPEDDPEKFYNEDLAFFRCSKCQKSMRVKVEHVVTWYTTQEQS